MTRPITAPGRLVAGRYRLQSQIGGGGMGTVWLARDELLGRQVAIKQVLSPPGADGSAVDEQRQRALREGRIAARLSHPHAISVYDVALENDQPWLVMEYLPSRSLAAVLTEDGVLGTRVVAQIGAQVADALAATHAAGIVHRDVKPANILIGEGGRVEGLVKITDFGISHASGDVTLTQTGQITGTPAFLAPEVAQGRPMTEASDVFSLGATLYTCLEGQPPFGMEENALAMLHRVAGGNIRPPLRAGMMADPLLKVLAAEPENRPTMTEVRDELAKLAAGRDGDTTTVLLARTDLRAEAEGRTRTATFPAAPMAAATPPPPPPRTLTSPSAPSGGDGAAAGIAAGAAAASAPGAAGAAPAAPPAADPPPVAAPSARTRPPGTRRARALWIATAVVGLVLAGLIVFWAVALDGDPDDPAGATSATSTSAEQTSSAEETTEATSSTTDEPTTTSESEAPPAQEPVQAVTDFFARIPGDLPAAYELTSPDFQSRFPYEERFAFFWEQFSSVQISNVEAEDDTTALVDITYTRPDGSSETERHRMTFATGDDGRLLLDQDVIA